MIRLGKLRRRLLLQYLVTIGLLLAGSETTLYFVSRWAGQRELDTALEKDIEKLASVLELEHDGDPEIEGQHDLDRVRIYGRTSDWQIIMEDGTTLGRSRHARGNGHDLPAVGGDAIPLDRLQTADTTSGRWGAVRAARLLTLRHYGPRHRGDQTRAGQIRFDIRAVVERGSLDAQLARLAWYLAGGFPIAMALAAAGGYYLIQRAIRPVEEAFQRERRFAGAASHELRTPLTALRGEIDVTLRHARTNAEYVEAIRRMDALVSRMTGLVEGLLILARANAGHLLLNSSELTVAKLATTINELTAHLPDYARIVTRCSAPRDLKIKGDGLLLAIAVRNLVENALLYGDHGPVQVTIAQRSEGGLEIRVEDEGPGVPPDILAAVSERVPTDVLPGHRTGGAGLGLSIVRAVVQCHGGALLLENRTESGCRAMIRLPVSTISR